jgi:hypothetical protein
MTTSAMERQKHEPEHVRSRQKRRQQTDRPEQLVIACVGPEEDFILAEEPGESGHARNRQRADEKCPVCQR